MDANGPVHAPAKSLRDPAYDVDSRPISYPVRFRESRKNQLFCNKTRLLSFHRNRKSPIHCTPIMGHACRARPDALAAISRRPTRLDGKKATRNFASIKIRPFRPKGSVL